MGIKHHSNGLHYVSEGHGRPVVLIHGLGSSRYDWESLRPALAAAGYRAYAVDLPGHGESLKPGDAEFYTLDNIYAGLEDWLDDLDPHQPYLVVAHSLGGYLSLEYARRHPGKLQAMALIDPLYTLGQIHPILRFFSRRPGLGIQLLPNLPNGLIDTVLGWDAITSANFSPQTRLQIIMDIKRASPHILNIPRTLGDLTPDLDQIEAPCLVIWGDKDLTLRPASFPPLVAALPDARGQVIKGSGHQPHVGKPELVNQMVLGFLEQFARQALTV